MICEGSLRPHRSQIDCWPAIAAGIDPKILQDYFPNASSAYDPPPVVSNDLIIGQFEHEAKEVKWQ